MSQHFLWSIELPPYVGQVYYDTFFGRRSDRYAHAIARSRSDVRQRISRAVSTIDWPHGWMWKMNEPNSYWLGGVPIRRGKVVL